MPDDQISQTIRTEIREYGDRYMALGFKQGLVVAIEMLQKGLLSRIELIEELTRRLEGHKPTKEVP